VRSPSKCLSAFLTPFSVPSEGEFRALRSATGALPLDPASAGLRWTSRVPKGRLVRYYKLCADNPPFKSSLLKN
ncbi:MAG: hypothetical protein NC253_02430, partial [Ruminococcus sp.]|nr:hypothetical protein [Ruminococcus sp.]